MRHFRNRHYILHTLPHLLKAHKAASTWTETRDSSLKKCRLPKKNDQISCIISPNILFISGHVRQFAPHRVQLMVLMVQP
jgi:hypothetical protein